MTEKQVPAPHPEGWLEIESLDIEAQGVARRADGKVVFVDGALPGELVTAKVHRRKNNWEQASLVEVHRESCLLYTSPSPRDGLLSRMPSSA